MSYIGNAPTTAAFLTDTFSGTGSQTAYTMTVAPANTSSILVSITGVLQDPSTYSVSGTTLTFSTAPPSGTSNISVRYLGIPASGVTTTAYRTVTNTTATAGQTSFTIPSYTVGYVDVYRNGVYLPTTDYTATTGTTVVLTNAATVGDTITTISFYVSSVLNAIPATAGSVSTSYLVDGSVTQAKLSTNVAGNGPAFYAYTNATQAISNNTFTKVALNATTFDTASNFNTSTYRFTPTVAGYYQFNVGCGITGASSVVQFVVAIYKNSNPYGARLVDMNPSASLSANSWISLSGAAILQMNGSTDYVELYAYTYGAGATIGNGNPTNGSNGAYFCGSLIRSN